MLYEIKNLNLECTSSHIFIYLFPIFFYFKPHLNLQIKYLFSYILCLNKGMGLLNIQ